MIPLRLSKQNKTETNKKLDLLLLLLIFLQLKMHMTLSLNFSHGTQGRNLEQGHSLMGVKRVLEVCIDFLFER